MSTVDSTYTLQQITLTGALNVENQINTEQEQVSSGVKTTNWQGLGNQATVLVTVSNQLANASQYIQNNSLLTTTLNSSSTAIGQIITQANNLLTLISQARDGAVANNLDFQGEVQTAWQSIAAQLNTQVNGSYIYSGTAINTAAANANVLPTSLTPSGDYYQGSDQNISATIQDGQTINTTILGSNTAFQQLAAGIANAVQGFNSGDGTQFATAYNYVEDAVSGITALQGQVGATESAVNNATEFLTTQKVALQTLHDDTINTDIVSVSTQLAENEANLQASFSSFAKINALNLVNYLT